MAGHAHVDHTADADRRIALLIAVLALFLALAETGAISRNVEVANLWAFFQARAIRQTTMRTAADDAARAAIARQQQAWRDVAQRWESEPATGEGRRELMARAQAAEAKREHSLAAYHMYEFGSAAFQVGTVLASASIITSVPTLALGVVGIGLTGLGFFALETVHL